jgi:hypothetical protein
MSPSPGQALADLDFPGVLGVLFSHFGLASGSVRRSDVVRRLHHLRVPGGHGPGDREGLAEQAERTLDIAAAQVHKAELVQGVRRLGGPRRSGLGNVQASLADRQGAARVPAGQPDLANICW